MTDLKPCPFCGGKAVERNYTADGGDHWITCVQCTVEQDAIEDWNKRYVPEGYALVPNNPEKIGAAMMRSFGARKKTAALLSLMRDDWVAAGQAVLDMDTANE